MKKPVDALPRTEDERSESFLGHFPIPGRLYLLTRRANGDRVLARLLGIDQDCGPLLLDFGILAIRPGPGNTLKQTDHGVIQHLLARADDLAFEWTTEDVNTDELATYVDMPYKSPDFDRALRGEERP